MKKTYAGIDTGELRSQLMRLKESPLVPEDSDSWSWSLFGKPDNLEHLPMKHQSGLISCCTLRQPGLRSLKQQGTLGMSEGGRLAVEQRQRSTWWSSKGSFWQRFCCWIGDHELGPTYWKTDIIVPSYKDTATAGYKRCVHCGKEVFRAWF